MNDYGALLGHTFDNIRQIGAGGGGTVFRAHHKRLDIDVVLKKIHVSKLAMMDNRAERDILKSLKHSYIPQVFDFIEAGQDVFTVMEFIPGQSFAQLLAQGTVFRQKDVRKWAKQLCEVVEYLHSQKPPIIHCDIKPANIMLTPKGDICLIDFNISGAKTEEGIASIGYSDGYSPVEEFAVVARKAVSPIQNKMGEAMSQGKPDPVILAEEDRTEIALWDTEIATEAAGAADDITEIAPEAVDDITEIAPEASADITEIDPEKTEEMISGNAAMDEAASGVSLSKSRLKSISDDDWVRAMQIAASTGNRSAVDERTDIYGIGASLYHILTGSKPAPFYRQYIPVQKRRPDVSESFAYIIDKAMSLKPSERFQSSAQLLKAVRNMEKIDSRYKRLVRRQAAVTVLLAAMAAASIALAAFGKVRINREIRDAYDTYISSMEEYRKEKNFEGVENTYLLAKALLVQEQDAYYEMAMAYFDQKDYEGCIRFLEGQVFSNPVLSENEAYSRFYYISGRCYLELEEYENASNDYKNAVALQPETLSYYSDYVIALVGNGQIDEAEMVLQEAVARQLSGDALSLLQGEIALSKKDYRTAEQALQDCIVRTENEYNLLRAYTKLDEVYKAIFQGTEQFEQRIALLTEALEELPDDKQITLLERLAQVYIDYGELTGESVYDQKAIELFRLMEKRGYATFQGRINIAILYEKDRDYEAAAAQLQSMKENFPDNYMIYKKLSLLELEIQDTKENKDRDYHTFEAYYRQTKELYESDSGIEDTEMLLLEQLYQDVKANGWL